MRVSASGDLAAYSSTDSGTPEIYVRSFPEPGAPERVSQGGGQFPFWSPDGNTIYYWAGSQGSTVTLMGARIQTGPPFVVTGTESILSGRYTPFSWSLHPEGDRFVVTQDVTSESSDAQAGGAVEGERHLIVVNWFEELKQRMGN